jgi:hypothetical protein
MHERIPACNPPAHLKQLIGKAGGFEAMADDLRTLLRLAAGRDAAPTAAVMDSRA